MTTDAPSVGTAPLLEKWFDEMDGSTPDRVLGYISDDFQICVVFSTGPGRTADFSGGREALVGYLAQREVNTRTHHILSASTVGPDELALGEVRRGGVFEASFVAAARVDSAGRATRLLIGRSPATRFGPADG
jgi:hypothetical protein